MIIGKGQNVSVVIALCLTCAVGMLGQSTSTGSSAGESAVYSQASMPFPAGMAGSGPAYAGERGAFKGFSFGAAASSGYNDNVLGSNLRRLGDETFNMQAALAYQDSARNHVWRIEYSPQVLLYKSVSARDAMGHGVDLDLTQRFTSRWALRFRNESRYRTGVFAQPHESTLLSPEQVNPMVIAPFGHQLLDSARVELTHSLSYRSGITFFGTYRENRFGTAVMAGFPLFSLRSDGGGAQYDYWLTRHRSIGLIYQYSNASIYRTSHFATNNILASLSQQYASGLQGEIHGGTIYSRTHEYIHLDLPFVSSAHGGVATLHANVYRAQWHPTVGGSLLKTTGLAALRIDGDHSIEDAGGLLPYPVISDVIAVSAQRRTWWAWRASVHAGFSQRTVIGNPFFDGGLRGFTRGIALTRPLSESLSLHLDYSYQSQHRHGDTPSRINVDRNLFAVGLRYRSGNHFTQE